MARSNSAGEPSKPSLSMPNASASSSRAAVGAGFHAGFPTAAGFSRLPTLEEAKKLGDILVVSVVDDRFVQKGPGRPFFDEATRLGWLSALEIVDYAVLCGDIGPYEVIRRIRPHIYVKGESCSAMLADPESGISNDKKTCESVGTKLVFTPELSTHSTELFNKIQQVFN